MENNIKYLIFDFGDVLGYPLMKNWFITPNFYKIIGTNIIDMDKFNYLKIKYNFMVSGKIDNEKEEFEYFVEFYKKVLKEMNISSNNELICKYAQEIAYDFVYNEDKVVLYSDTKQGLEKLANKYKLILLSDNWPCVFKMLKKWDIEKYFDKIYISSIYNCLKRDKVFFDFPINEYNIKENEAVFIDDNINLLEIAEEKGLIPILMDRSKSITDCKYRIINELL